MENHNFEQDVLIAMNVVSNAPFKISNKHLTLSYQPISPEQERHWHNVTLEAKKRLSTLKENSIKLIRCS
jgi:hypothetical protein